MVETPPVRRRLLGAALRRYRESLGYRLDDVARILECDRSKISVRHEAHCFIARKAGRDERRYLWVQCLTGARKGDFRENSMVGNRRPCPDVRGGASGDPHDKVKV
jgi:hypothetical protein